MAHGQRSHLFYLGDDRPHTNFEFQAEVMTKPGSNGGMFFQTRWQERDWPLAGMEVQVNNTYTKDPIKTGSLYQLRDVTKAPAKDETSALAKRAYERGLVTITAGTYGNIMRTLMPLVIDDAQLAEGLDVLEACLAEVAVA